MKTYLLVHGAWHGAWCWRRIDEPLRRAGHSVHAPTLTGLADRSHLLSRDVTLETHIDDVANLIRWHELRNVVLVGHSYGGMVISGVADRMADRVRSLVYVDAFVPENGQSSLDQMPPTRRAEHEARIREAGQGWFSPPLPAQRMGVTEPSDIAWVDALCTPMPARCMMDPIRLTGAWRGVARKIHILGSANPASAFLATHERLRDDPAWQTERIACGHEIMITNPDELAGILLDA